MFENTAAKIATIPDAAQKYVTSAPALGATANGNSPFEQARKYLARVVPWNGLEFVGLHYTIQKAGMAKPVWLGRPCRNLDQAINQLKWLSQQPDARDVYVSMATQKECDTKTSKAGKPYTVARRSRENAGHLKSLFLDIDVKDGGYATPKEAAVAVSNFIAAVALPKPSAVVASGSGGLHIYWSLVDPLTVEEWQPLADALCHAAQQHGLKFDSQCTVDCVRILRVPDTFNHKNGEQKPVELKLIRETEILNATMVKALQPFMVARPVVSAAASSTPDVNDELGAGSQTGAAPRDILAVSEQCQWIWHSLDTGGRDNNNPLWFFTLRIATFCKDVDDTGHWLSYGHSDYHPDETQQELERLKKDRVAKPNIGFPTCKKIADTGAPQCATCPHLALGKSPLSLPGVTVAVSLPATAGSEAKSDPIVLDSVEVHQNAKQIYAALKDRISLFQHGGKLKTIGEVELSPPPSMPNEKARIQKGATTSALVPVNRDWLRAQASKHLSFRLPKGNKLMAVRTPERELVDIIAAPDIFYVPVVRQVVEAPFITATGEIICTPGYHPEEKIFLASTMNLDRLVPENPTKEDALDALKAYRELLAEFPFVDEASFSAAISMIFTLLMRNLMPNAPLHATVAPMAGTGKSFLQSLATLIAYNRELPVSSPGKTEEEFEKRLDTAIIEGHPVVALDNVNGVLKGDKLCQILTQAEISCRVLGKSEAVKAPNRVSVLANGNNLVLPDDMVRRSILISLDADMDRPEFRKFGRDATILKQEIQRDRPLWVARAFTIVKAFLRALEKGEAGLLSPLNSFSEWSAFIRSPIVWLGCADPVLTQDRIRSDDPERTRRIGIFSAFCELTRDPAKNTYLRTTVKDALSPVWNEGLGKWSDTHRLRPQIDVLCEIVPLKPGTRPTLDVLTARLGYYFRSNVNAVVDGLKLVKVGTNRNGLIEWQLVGHGE